ncbi:MAG: hypothetical protein PF482_15340 [Desulfobacteraceae bacterium]|jgi:hypothetical protein|nr:hypothetical protein [Desulfobacteraceae bacterium]
MKGQIANRFFHLTFMSITVLSALFLVEPCWAQMKALNDAQLSDTYALGFSDFTIITLGNGTTDTNALFNINSSSYITIDSLKLGYYNDNQLNSQPTITSTAWDEDWTNIQIGGSLTDPTKDFTTQGAYLQANFSNIDDPTIRTLNSITIGATSATGDISAVFDSFSGSIADGTNGPITDAHRLEDLGLGAPGTMRTITAADSPLSILLSLTNGYQVNFGAGSTYQ